MNTRGYTEIYDEIVHRRFDHAGADNALAARLAAEGIMAAETDQQVLDMVQAIGDAV